MRTRIEIESDGKRSDLRLLEVLLDVRELILEARGIPKAPPYVKNPIKPALSPTKGRK